MTKLKSKEGGGWWWKRGFNKTGLDPNVHDKCPHSIAIIDIINNA